jgi:SAM-dependent methyltransferase
MTSAAPPVRDAAPIRALSHQSTNDRILALVAPHLTAGARVLDLGAGEGYFSKAMGDLIAAGNGATPAPMISACDVTPEIYRYAAVRCNRIGPDGRLPYPDATFDLVCSLEVVEHVEDQFGFCREILRVLRPGGLAVLSTPNVLNLNSRWRILHSGFATLFNPLSLSTVDVVHTSGHIHPVSYYYLSYALRRAGAESVTVSYDRFKTSATWLYVLLWPVLTLGNLGFRMKLRRGSPDVLRQNARLLDDMRSRAMLTARSIILSARKP